MTDVTEEPGLDAGLEASLEAVRSAMEHACDLLAERTYGNPARSPGHNARLTIERALPYLSAAIAAYEAHRSGAGEPVAVKPLEWRFFDVKHDHGKGVWDANGPWSTFTICDCEEWDATGERYYVPHLSKTFPTLDEAKAVAQADYEKRILSALASPAKAGEPCPMTFPCERLTRMAKAHSDAVARARRMEEALRDAADTLEGLSYIHDGNPSDARADMSPVEYARHMLYEARQIAKAAHSEARAVLSDSPASAARPAVADALRAAKWLCDNMNEFGQCTDSEGFDRAEAVIRAALESALQQAPAGEAE